jgi:hypothetical protein
MQNALILVLYWFCRYVPLFYVAQPPTERVSQNFNSVSERCARPLAERDANEFTMNGILMKYDTVGL